jgi:hypothetical protein
MTATIQAIETRYAGCRFRSRLEARWAVFFDTAGITWEYEPQGFVLPSGDTYLPDFRLPQHDLWVEVKGDPDELRRDQERYAAAAHALPGRGLMFLGQVPDLRDGMPQHFVVVRERHCCGEEVLCLHVAWAEMLIHDSAIGEFGLPCTDLISHTPRFLPATRGYNGGRATWSEPGPVPDPRWPIDMVTRRAYEAARSARFEHGESG